MPNFETYFNVLEEAYSEIVLQHTNVEGYNGYFFANVLWMLSNSVENVEISELYIMFDINHYHFLSDKKFIKAIFECASTQINDMNAENMTNMHKQFCINHIAKLNSIINQYIESKSV